jgi:hypothetical protein
MGPSAKPPLPPAPPLERRGPGRPPKQPAPPAAGEPAKAATPATPPRPVTETTIRAAYVGLWFLLRFVGSLLGFQSDVKSLPEPELKEDLPELTAWAREYPSWALRVLAWIGGPLVVFQRVSQHFTRRKMEKAGAKLVPPAGADA